MITVAEELRRLRRAGRRAWVRLQLARLADWLRPIDEPALRRAVRTTSMTALWSVLFLIGFWYGPAVERVLFR